MALDPETFERARLSVMDEMGWDDDRHLVGRDYPISCWGLAGGIVTRIWEVVQPDNRKRGPYERGICPVCGKEYALARGVLRLHDQGMVRCSGTSSLPKEEVDRG